jgi:hypothetical protein
MLRALTSFNHKACRTFTSGWFLTTSGKNDGIFPKGKGAMSEGKDAIPLGKDTIPLGKEQCLKEKEQLL